jgi:Exostosin family
MLLHLPLLDDPYLDQPVAAFNLHAATDRVGAHKLTDSAQSADAILFTQCHMMPADWRMKRLRSHPLTRAYREKVLVWNELDRPWCALPGVYVNMPRRDFVARHQRAWGYFVPPAGEAQGDRDLLFSFVASNTARCRAPLFRLRHPRAVVEEVRGFRFWDPASERFAEQRARFQTLLGRSRFVLCPRGAGTSSVRLYEALAAGAVPVVIADQWIPPAGPAWESFSLRWPEGRTDGLIALLERREQDWPALSNAARRAYEEHFSPANYFHNVASLCADLLASGSPASFPRHGVIDRRLASLAIQDAANRLRHARTRLHPAKP